MSKTTFIGLALIILNVAALVASWVATGEPPSDERFVSFGSLLLIGMGLVKAADERPK
jgi:drug/metabolite transporter (DMT)-like permease